jgi:hypothetical protein
MARLTRLSPAAARCNPWACHKRRVQAARVQTAPVCAYVLCIAIQARQGRHILCRWREPPEYQDHIHKARRADTSAVVSALRAFDISFSCSGGSRHRQRMYRASSPGETRKLNIDASRCDALDSFRPPHCQGLHLDCYAVVTYANNFSTTFPATSVKRKSLP